MIPKSVDIKGPWKVLPPGIHVATLDEIKGRLAGGPKRRALFEGFARAVESLRKAGCTNIFLDGSFVTDKTNPGDFDGCWDPIGVDTAKLDPVLLDFRDLRKAQKAKFGGEFFLSSLSANGTSNFLDFFQIDKHTGSVKGIIKVQLH